METLKEKTAKGLFWGGLGNFIQQLLNLIFGIFLARLLSQSDYGMVGMLTIFSQMAGTLQEGGFAAYLITSGIDNHFLSFMIKVVFTATVYLSVLWILQSNIIREVYLFIRKREITQ